MRATLFLLLLLGLCGPLLADWPAFHGPGGAGKGEGKIPASWGDTENVLWKVKLPGTGSSSPVIAGGRLFVTSWMGTPQDLERHVLCADADTGSLLWDKTVKSILPEQDRIREEHGYASATPVATDTHVFAFFGKSGVFCFDHSGKQLWQADVGSGLDGWGSAASLTLWKDSLLVNACIESGSLVALDTRTGKEKWRAAGIKECWHAPLVAQEPEGDTVIMAMAGAVHAFDAATGVPRWQCKSGITWYMCPLPVVQDGVVYAVGGRSGVGGLAIKSGGSGEVTATHRLWTLQQGTNVPSPVMHSGHLYFVHDVKAEMHCVDVKTGEFVFSEPIPGIEGVYASPVLVDGKIIVIGRGGRCAVLQAAPEFKVLASPVLENGRGLFNATPAVHADRLYIRSKQFLYCIGTK